MQEGSLLQTKVLQAETLQVAALLQDELPSAVQVLLIEYQ